MFQVPADMFLDEVFDSEGKRKREKSLEHFFLKQEERKILF
jgi:hypothetical protein